MREVDDDGREAAIVMQESSSLSSRHSEPDRSDTVLSAEHISKSFGGIAALVSAPSEGMTDLQD